MTNTARRYLIAALTLFSVISLPRLTYAGQITGTLSGTADLDVEFLENFIVVGEFVGTVPATLSIFVDTETPSFLMEIETSVVSFFANIVGPEGFGPPITYSITPNSISVSGEVAERNGPGAAEFAVFFQSVSPDGVIQNATGSAAVNDLNLSGGGGFGAKINSEVFQSFHLVPEPSSIVMAASGAFMLLVYAGD